MRAPFSYKGALTQGCPFHVRVPWRTCALSYGLPLHTGARFICLALAQGAPSVKGTLAQGCPLDMRVSLAQGRPFIYGAQLMSGSLSTMMPLAYKGTMKEAPLYERGILVKGVLI